MMTRTISLLAAVSALSAPVASGQTPAPRAVADVKTVYVLPMGSGMDQLLASRLTSMGVFRVVTDPKLADAVLSESLGPQFEERLAELYPPAAPPDEESKAKPKPDATAEDEASPEAAPSRDARPEFRPKTSVWAKGKGTFFLVEPRGREVLWSTFIKPGPELDKRAERVAKELRKAKGLE